MHIGARQPYLIPSRAGLGQLTPGAPVPAPAPGTVPTDPLYARLIGAFGTPIVGALSTRIAAPGSRAGSGFYQPYPGGGGSFGFAGISQSTLLIGVLAIGAVLIFSKS